MKKSVAVIMLILSFTMVACSSGETIANRYTSNEEFSQVVEELGYENVMFISGWGYYDTEEAIDTITEIPAIRPGEKVSLVVAEKNNVIEIIVLPQSLSYEINTIPYNFPSLTEIQQIINEFNTYSTETCSGDILLNNQDEFQLFPLESYKMTEIENELSMSNPLVLYIGHTCVNSNDLSVMMIQTSDNSFEIFASSTDSDIYEQLISFNINE